MNPAEAVFAVLVIWIVLKCTVLSMLCIEDSLSKGTKDTPPEACPCGLCKEKTLTFDGKDDL